MKTRILGILLAILMVVFVFALTGCEDAFGSLFGEHEHQWSEWEIITEPTCTEKGEKTRFCNCGESETVDIDATGHIYKNGVCLCGDVDYENLFIFTLLDDGTYSIKAKDVTLIPSDVIIPKSYNNKYVTKIADLSFLECNNLTSVTIPDSVVDIGAFAFAFCSRLTSITVDEDNQYYKSIDGNLYSKDEKTLIQYANGKKDLSFEIPDSVEVVADYAFNHYVDLTRIVIGNGVTSISARAFNNCSKLTSITVDEDNQYYKSIDGNLYSKDKKTLIQYADGKKDLSFKIPDSVEVVVDYAFNDCFNLTSVVIGNGVISIGEMAFDGCSKLTSITVDEDNQYYKSIDGNLYSKDEKTLIKYADGKKDLSFEIPNSIEFIGNNAFYDCDNLTSIVMPNSVTSIGDYAFAACSNLTSIMIPNNVTSIGYYAFAFCSNLASIVIGDSVTSIGVGAFYDCNSALYTEYKYGKYVKSGDNPYAVLIDITNKNISTYEIHEDTKIIAYYAFYECSRLSSIIIPDSVTSIADSAFYGCDSLTDVYYTGSAKDWAEISTGYINYYLAHATIHYNYVPEE